MVFNAKALGQAETAAIRNFKARRTPTPLATFLYIYNYASHECYINHMEGAKVLAKYLAPIDLGTGIQLDMEKVSVTIPDMLVSYELTELARILKPHTTAPYNISAIQIENAIYEYLTKSR